ncbi:MAG: ROK family protein [Bacteroidales bacterium]|nr:ROK family protein [Bacteroidales bacterium]
MKALFNSDLTKNTNESRLMQQKLRIIQAISQNGYGITVPEICDELQISPPTGIKLVNQLREDGFLSIIGKKETQNGRRPFIYGLRNVNFHAISIEILLKRISVAIIDSRLNILYYRQKTDFELNNTVECLKSIEAFINTCIENSGILKDSILGMGIGITGSVISATGESLTYFNFMDQPLGTYMSEKYDMPVFLNNDTRCFGQAEKIIGKARDVNHAIVINLSRGLGTSLIIENKIVNGGKGFAGELGHMQFGTKEKMCICGKSKCLGNDVGGYALEQNFLEKISEGEKSMLSKSATESMVRYDEIMQAALVGDDLSIRLIQEMGVKLGNALGNIVSLLNPDLIIIGGKFSKLKSILFGPVKTGITNTALVNPLNHCQIEFSELGDLGGLKGAGALVFEHYKLIRN